MKGQEEETLWIKTDKKEDIYLITLGTFEYFFWKNGWPDSLRLHILVLLKNIIG